MSTANPGSVPVSARRTNCLRVARLLGFAALLGLAPALAVAGCRLKAMQLPVKMVNSRPIAMLGLNGAQVPMLVDTGAFFSMLTDAAASQLQLRTRALPEGMRINGFTGSIQARMTRVDKVQLSNGTIPNVEFIVGLNEVGGGAMGVIGRNFLALADSEYDLAHGMIRLVVPTGDCGDENMAYWAGDTEANIVPLAPTDKRERNGAFIASISVNGKQMKALLDTGAPESTLMLTAARSAGIKESDLTPDRVMGGGSGHARSWLAHVDTLDLGAERVMHNTLTVVDTDWAEQDAVLGVDWFLSHRVFIARSQDRLYATWNGGPIFVRNSAPAQEEVAASGAAPDAGASPADADALVRRATASAARRDFAHALADLDRACALAPRDGDCFAARARVHAAMKQPAEALADLDEALRLDPAAAQARMDRAMLRVERRDRDGAMADLRILDSTLPAQSNLRAAMANADADLDQADDALRQWDLWLAAHRHDGTRDHVLNGRCWMRMKLKLELDRALQDCLEAVDENPDQASYRDSLGWVYLRRGEWPKAIKAFDAAIALRAASPWSFYGLGIAHLRQGAKAAAETDLAQARLLMPDIDIRARPHGMAAE